MCTRYANITSHINSHHQQRYGVLKSIALACQASGLFKSSVIKMEILPDELLDVMRDWNDSCRWGDLGRIFNSFTVFGIVSTVWRS